MSKLRAFAPDILVIIILFALPLGFFAQQTLGGKTLIPTENIYQYAPYAAFREEQGAPAIPHNALVSDLVLQNFQWKSFVRDQLSRGEVPLWNPHQFSGIPFLAAGQHSALYPLSILYYGMDLPSAYGWFTVVNLWLAGAFMYAFVRGIGVGRAGGLLAGIVYQFSGFTIASVVFQMMIGGLPWLPLLLLMSEFILRQRKCLGRASSLPWMVIGAGALAMNVLAGHVEITIYTLLITGYYAAWRWLWLAWQQRKAGLLLHLRKAGYLVAMVLLGIGLAALQFIPLYEFAQTNWRAERSSLAQVLSFAHPPRGLLQYVIPNVYGNPTHHSYVDVFSGATITEFTNLAGEPITTIDWGIKNYVEGALYVGILPLLLAAYALIDRGVAWRNHPLRANSLGTSRPHKKPDQDENLSEADEADDEAASSQSGRGVGRSGEPPYRRIFASLGLISLTFMFGLPTYAIIYALPGINQLNSAFRWVFGVTVCVAVLAAFGLDAVLRRVAVKEHRLMMGFGYGTAILATLGLIGLAFSYLVFDPFEPIFQRLVESLAKADQAFSDGRMFYSYQWPHIAIFLVVLLLCGLVAIWAGKMRAYRRVHWLTGFIIVIAAADLMIASWGFNPASDPAHLAFEPPAVQWLRDQYDDAQPFRYTTLQDPQQPVILNANLTWRYGLDDVRGYDSIIPKAYMDTMQALAPQVQRDFNRIAPIFTQYGDGFDYRAALASPQLDWLNVRYVVTHKPLDLSDLDYALAYDGDPSVNIWENPAWLPRAFSLPADTDTATLTLPAAPQALTIRHNTGREKLIDVSLEDAALLVISENYDAGWRAFYRVADDAEETQVEVERVFGNLQGVQLPAAARSVRLVYSPTHFQVGLFTSAISGFVLIFVSGAWLWGRFVGTNRADISATAKVARNSIAPIVLNLFNRGIDFALAFVIYRLLSQEMVGVYNFAIVIFVWFDIFTNFGLDVFLTREVSREKVKSGFYLFNTSFLRLWLSVLGLGLLILFLAFWQNSVEPLPQEGLIALVILYIGLFPASLSKGVTSLYYAFEQAERPAAIATVTTLIKAVGGVAVLLLGWGIVGLAAISIANNILTLILLLWGARGFIQQLPRKPDVPLLRGMVGESWPLMLNHFLATIFFQIDIVILQALRGAQAVAQYSTAYKWLLAINIVPAFFTQAVFPMMSRQAREDKDALRRTYRFGIKLMIALALPIAVGFTFLAETLTLLLAGPRYLPNGAIALQLMIWSIPLGWMNSLTQYALIALDLQRWITRAFFAAVAFNVVSNLIFIPQFGFQAAAVTTILSELALWVPFAWLMQRGLAQSVGWRSLVWRPLVATGVMIAAILALWPVQMILALSVGSAVYVAVLLALRPLDAHELAILRPMLPERVRGLPFFHPAPL